ncbi:Methylcrotonoyl-CoA carboxylase beta chain, mitochondrial [Platysternon megacephalum]|uniref:Methylcrotonoyl-CoA carboxylase beta chain, mitochondrial n=1 Tax=Platysternon megacephalum TaxID=55544 RepID=A0A4D9DXW8_9SAUR|nr:Methylcrotonoyl-CoA carboxylase beta chain, mitochondrial [Platysternon megacephalum]
MWNNITSCSLWRLSPSFMSSRIQTLTPLFIRNYRDFCKNRQTIWTLRNSLCQVMKKTVPTLKCNMFPHCFVSNKARYGQYTKTFPVLDGSIPSVCEHVFEENLRNSEACIQRYSELLCKVSKGGGENAILRHTQRNKKLLVRERLRMLLDDETFLELSPFAGFDLPYGDVPAAGCLTANCGRSFDPNFLFLWPNARVALVDSRHISTFPQARDDDCTGDDSELKHLKEKLDEESSAFHSSARLWDDGIILPQNSRKVIAQCLTIMKQQKYQIASQQHYPVIRL